jgi:hypothetical protein
MPTQATYDDANLLLRLYELRREETLRRARQWFTTHCVAGSLDDLMRIAPPGSPENGYVRMVVSYWEMAASFVTAGVLNQELFFQSSGEMLFVWERVRPALQAIRDFLKNPHAWKNLEIVATAYVKWMESHGPEAYPAFQESVRMAATMTAPSAPPGK